MKDTLKSILVQAVAKHRLVQFVRDEFERPGSHLVGVPVAFGNEWLLFARMDDSIRLDGFDALRLADIARIRSSFKNRAFYVRGLASKRRTAATNASYNLISTRALLESIQANNALLTIEREAGDADGTDVGRITSFARHDCAMRTISPGAVWRSGRERIAYKDITRIGFGSEYDETIAAVAQLVSPLWR